MLRTAFFALVLAVSANPALADKGSDDKTPVAAAAAISQEDAVGIAQSRGVISVREVKLDDGAWKIEGVNKEGRKIEVRVSASTGDVIKVETY